MVNCIGVLISNHRVFDMTTAARRDPLFHVVPL
jgi:hypothetical protein